MHQERLKNGWLIDVHVRLSQNSEAQLFIGIYDGQGSMLFEDAFLSRPGESMSQAMEWGIRRAKEVVVSLDAPAAASQPESLPRRGSRQAD
jgi:hypothetical protein